MPKITFLPIQQSFEVQPGESILDVALNHDVPIQHACGGFCACTTCQLIVVSGGENLSPMEEAEEDRLEEMGFLDSKTRLGCQTKIQGDVVVEIVNLDT